LECHGTVRKEPGHESGRSGRNAINPGCADSGLPDSEFDYSGISLIDNEIAYASTAQGIAVPGRVAPGS
jgi:hypothetical protein